MCKDFSSQFLSWMGDKTGLVYLCSGSDLSKLHEQVPNSIISRVAGIFCSMGNELYIDNKKIYSRDFVLPDDIHMWLNGRNCSSQCPHEYRATRHFEYRTGCLNFSFCGRDVTKEQRQLYTEWDAKTKERADLVKAFNENYNSEGYEACLGGEISVDIQPVGCNKVQAVEWILDNKGGEIIFVGDKCFPGGNDYAPCQYINENGVGAWHNVDDPTDTLLLLHSI